MSETNTKRIIVDSVMPSLPSPVEYTQSLLGLQPLPGSGHGVNICLIDSGVPDHTSIITLGGDINFTGSPDSRDRTGHATVLAGVMVGNSPEQITGIAPNAMLLIAKAVDDSCIVRFDALVASILWGIIKEADVIVIPISSDLDNSSVRAAIIKARKMGICIVAPTGNNRKVEFPAAYPEVLSVGTLTSQGNMATFSCSGDVNLRGTNCETTYLDQTYAVASGTSLSSAIAGALCAKIIERFKRQKIKYTPDMVFKEVKALCEVG